MKSWTPLKNHYIEQSIFRNRARFAFAVVIALSLLLLSRLFVLQVLQYDRFATASDKNRIQTEPIVPTRGLIFDRNNELVANNKPSFKLALVVEQVSDMDETLSIISKLITLNDEQIIRFKKVSKQYHRPYEPVRLRSKLSETEIAIIAVNQHKLPGIRVLGELVRNYPHLDNFAHSVGYVGRLNEKETTKLIDPSNYKGTHYFGKTGLEKFYENSLHGQTGSRKIETDAHGKVLRVLEQKDPAPGENLHLYLDLKLQKLASELLGDHRGAIIAIDPKTGGILSFVSKPSFNPNLFVTGISQKDYSELRDSPNQPLFNRTIQGRYPPGSTIKPFIALAGLEYNKTNWYKKIEDPGWYKLENEDRLYRDWKKTGHGRVDLDKAIYQSCDTYFYDLSLNLGIDNMHAFMSRFGFGAKTGIDIGPESSGLLPSRQWKRKNRKTQWYPGETLIAGIGQGFMLATPLQLAVSTATLANKGVIVTPKLVKRVGDQSTQSSRTHDSNLVGPPAKDIMLKNEKNWAYMFSSMRKVMHSSKGTAYGSGRGARYKIAGKTGTAQVKGIKQNETYDLEKTALRHRDHGLFVGFAPINDPQIAIAVLVENGGGGSSAAAPLARKIFDQYLLE